MIATMPFFSFKRYAYRVYLCRLHTSTIGLLAMLIAFTSFMPLTHTGDRLPDAGKVQPAVKPDITVAQDGSGDYTTVQEAINAAPDNGTMPFRIYIKAGRYTEQLVIPASKTFVELIGEHPATTIISYGDGKGGTTAVTINADDCLLLNITLENTQGRIADGPQSLAVKINADRVVLSNCRLISGQDTVLANKAGKRHYFSHCYIDGNTDFIYGAAIAVFDDCVIYARDRMDKGKGGYITAGNTPPGQAYGLVFRHCQLPDNHGATQYTLGRPWQNDSRTRQPRAENKAVFLDTRMGHSIVPAGWSVWDTGTITGRITYAEYRTTGFDGKPTDVSKRVAWSKQLTEAEAAPYYQTANLFGNWDPFAVWSDLPKTTNTPFIALANFRLRQESGNTTFWFNTCWPVRPVTYTLYRSVGDQASFRAIQHFTVKEDTSIAFACTETSPKEQGSYYFVKAEGLNQVAVTDTLTVSGASMTQ